MGIAADYRGPSGKILPGAKMSAAEIIEKLRPLFAQQKEVVLAYLFGSYACSKVRETSDIDVAVLLESDVKGEKLCDAYRDIFLLICEALDTERFDLVLLNRAPLSLRFEIVSRGKLIYARDEEMLNGFEIDVIRKYQDTAHLRRVQDQYLKERAREWYSKERASAPA